MNKETPDAKFLVSKVAQEASPKLEAAVMKAYNGKVHDDALGKFFRDVEERNFVRTVKLMTETQFESTEIFLPFEFFSKLEFNNSLNKLNRAQNGKCRKGL